MEASRRLLSCQPRLPLRPAVSEAPSADVDVVAARCVRETRHVSIASASDACGDVAALASREELASEYLPIPREVVDLYKSNNITAMKIYDPNSNVLDALAGSNITVIVGVFNEDLLSLAWQPSAADAWVATNIAPRSGSVRFRYISVGNEVIPGGLAPHVLPAMRNIYDALRRRGLHDGIKVSTSVSMAVLASSYPPSTGAFSDEALVYLRPLVQFLKNTGAPFLLNMYPYFAYRDNPTDISLHYALFTSPGVVVQDGSFGYQNLFDAMFDAVLASLEKVDGAKVKIVVSETGWPSAGGFAASIVNARTYNQNLIRHVRGGTPRTRGIPIEAYLFAMFNENEKPGPDTERNFGLFYPKQHVYPISFT